MATQKINPTDEAVATYLSTIFVLYNVTYCGETKQGTWECDQWRVTFQRGKAIIETMYYTGLGHRTKAKVFSWHNLQHPREKDKWHRQNDKPKAPTAATVLHSLLLDSMALDTSFEYWCQDFGGDSDSIKSFNVYQACCEIGKQVKALFNHEEVKNLNELLQDY